MFPVTVITICMLVKAVIKALFQPQQGSETYWRSPAPTWSMHGVRSRRRDKRCRSITESSAVRVFGPDDKGEGQQIVR